MKNKRYETSLECINNILKIQIQVFQDNQLYNELLFNREYKEKFSYNMENVLNTLLSYFAYKHNLDELDNNTAELLINSCISDITYMMSSDYSNVYKEVA